MEGLGNLSLLYVPIGPHEAADAEDPPKPSGQSVYMDGPSKDGESPCLCKVP